MINILAFAGGTILLLALAIATVYSAWKKWYPVATFTFLAAVFVTTRLLSRINNTVGTPGNRQQRAENNDFYGFLMGDWVFATLIVGMSLAAWWAILKVFIPWVKAEAYDRAYALNEERGGDPSNLVLMPSAKHQEELRRRHG